MKPQRIQLSRKKGWRKPANTVVVARPSKWGNPFTVADVIDHYHGDRLKAQADCVRCFREWLWNTEDGKEVRSLAATGLRGKNLACWCKPGEPCHADVLLEIANA